MFQQIISIFLLIILAVCVIGLLVCFGALGIIYLSKYSAFFMKLYLYFFDREEYNIYKEAKKLVKTTGTIPVCSSFTDTTERKGLYILVFEKTFSLWKDDKCYLVDLFHGTILNELVKKANLKDSIEETREKDIKHRERLNNRIKQLEQEIAERKARLAQLENTENA